MRTTLLIALLAAFSAEAGESGPRTLQSPGELAEQARAAITEIAPAELSSRPATDAQPLLIDVRTEREFQAGHLRGARWIPRGKLEFSLGNGEERVDREIILYCRTDARSALAAQSLQAMGFTRVSSLKGGFKQWVLEGRSVYNQHGEIRVLEFEAGESR